MKTILQLHKIKKIPKDSGQFAILNTYNQNIMNNIKLC